MRSTSVFLVYLILVMSSQSVMGRDFALAHSTAVSVVSTPRRNGLGKSTDTSAGNPGAKAATLRKRNDDAVVGSDDNEQDVDDDDATTIDENESEEFVRKRPLRRLGGGSDESSTKQARRGPLKRPGQARKTQATKAAPGGPNNNNKDEDSRPGFDFIIAGFPKCGTTTLLKAFGLHAETDMAASEQCAIASPLQADAKVHRLLDQTLSSLSSEPTVKRSFKCPTAMYNYKSIARMEKHSPNAKFVVGMRHPVKMLQSFYNYRITEIKERGLEEEIPPLEQILSTMIPWKGVSIHSTRFELFLMQLGKTNVTPEQMRDLVREDYDLAIKPTSFKVFLYTVDQLEDSNEDRATKLRVEMQHFLGLQAPIQPFGHENQNHAVGDAAHSESISICDDKWAAARVQLVQQGAETAKWLREEFIESEDVVVANKEHFIQTLESWGTDPCIKKAAPVETTSSSSTPTKTMTAVADTAPSGTTSGSAGMTGVQTTTATS